MAQPTNIARPDTDKPANPKSFLNPFIVAENHRTGGAIAADVEMTLQKQEHG